MNGILFEIPLSGEIMTTVRLVTGGIGSLAGLDMDDSEDCKVCLTESLLMLSHRGYTRARISFEYGQGLNLTVEGEERTGKEQNKEEDEISAALLSALAQNAVFEKTDGCISVIKFSFGLQA